MLVGVPTMVDRPPTFAAMTSGISKTKGSASMASAMRMVMGVISNMVVTLSRIAELTAVMAIRINISNHSFPLDFLKAKKASQRKTPVPSTTAMTIIMPMIRKITFQSMEPTASPKPKTMRSVLNRCPTALMASSREAPSKAARALCMGVAAMRNIMKAKITRVIQKAAVLRRSTLTCPMQKASPPASRLTVSWLSSTILTEK